jgi:hypothetical protein
MTSTVTVFCTGCRTQTETASRTAYSMFEDQHRTSCNVQVVLYRATLDDLLDLPPDLASDLHRDEPVWRVA